MSHQVIKSSPVDEDLFERFVAALTREGIEQVDARWDDDPDTRNSYVVVDLNGVTQLRKVCQVLEAHFIFQRGERVSVEYQEEETEDGFGLASHYRYQINIWRRYI